MIVINGEAFRGYVDSGYEAVTIKKLDVEKLRLVCVPVSTCLYGYAGGTVFVYSKVTIALEVDLASAIVKALVIPDNAQNILIIVGQPFVNNENIMVVLHSNQIRLFNKNNDLLSTVNKLPTKIQQRNTCVPSCVIPLFIPIKRLVTCTLNYSSEIDQVNFMSFKILLRK